MIPSEIAKLPYGMTDRQKPADEVRQDQPASIVAKLQAIIAAHIPEGYEVETGFHFGRDPEWTDFGSSIPKAEEKQNAGG
jgi:hypothetical protein